MELNKTTIRLSKDDFALIDRSYEILAKDILWNYTIPQLARKVGINEKKLKFGFKLLYGTTIHEFVAKEKLEKAKELLGKNELPISEIANRSGYNSISYFSQAFKKAFNVTPSQWITQFVEN